MYLPLTVKLTREGRGSRERYASKRLIPKEGSK